MILTKSLLIGFYLKISLKFFKCAISSNIKAISGYLDLLFKLENES